MTAPAADEVTRAERTLTVTEALDQGWFVADFFRGEELIRRYGRTAEEAHARLLSEFEAGVTVQAPRGGVVTAPAEPRRTQTLELTDCGPARDLLGKRVKLREPLLSYPELDSAVGVVVDYPEDGLHYDVVVDFGGDHPRFHLRNDEWLGVSDAG